jgi:hypothetical protein
MWENVSYQITNHVCSNTDAELLLVSGLDYIVRIFLCLQVSTVKINSAVSTEIENISRNSHYMKYLQVHNLKKEVFVDLCSF